MMKNKNIKPGFENVKLDKTTISKINALAEKYCREAKDELESWDEVTKIRAEDLSIRFNNIKE